MIIADRWTLATLLLTSIMVGCTDTPSRAVDGGALDGTSAGSETVSWGDGPARDVPVNDATAPGGFPTDEQSRFWIHTSVNSALIYWQAGPIELAATSRVEFGDTASYGHQTNTTQEARWAQLHRLNGLQAATTYHFRMIQTTTGGDQISTDRTFTTAELGSAVQIPGSLAGPPYVLDQDDARYVLTADISAGANAIEITGNNVNLDLNGHTVTFGASDNGQCFGIYIKSPAMVVLGNGHVIQGDAAGDYSSGLETRWRAAPVEIFGITTDVHRPNGYPIRLFGSAQEAEIHHNHLASRVTEIESRHYPGNDLLRVDVSGPGISIHDNLLTEGAHRGLTVSGDGEGAEVAYNDIRHHARYVNGYALACSAGAMKVHHNRVTSTGRGVHLTRADLELDHNYLDIKGHMTLDDMPQGSRPFQERMIELHGIKFEEAGVVRAKVHDNYVRIIQHLTDADWDYVPATPLNIACYGPDAGNEVYENTFVALTEYTETRHGGYGDSGQWASPIYLVGMNKGPASSGNYSIYVHDNTFMSNDLFVSASAEVDMTVRIENNSFTLVTDPPPTTTHTPFRGLGAALEQSIKSGGNSFSGMSP